MKTKVSRIMKVKAPGSHALSIVRKYFPQVTSVEDAKEPIEVEVTSKDSSSAAVRNHESCAMAVACKRKAKADGVIISMDVAYIIKGGDAFRFKVPPAVQREIVSFDREAGFASGSYILRPFPPSHYIGHARASGKDHGPSGKVPRHIHITSGIRTVLGSDTVR